MGAPGIVKQYSGTANDPATPAIATEIRFTATVQTLIVRNADAANNLQVSLDQGRGWCDLDPGERIEEENLRLQLIRLRETVPGGGGGADYEVIVVEQ